MMIKDDNEGQGVGQKTTMGWHNHQGVLETPKNANVIYEHPLFCLIHLKSEGCSVRASLQLEPKQTSALRRQCWRRDIWRLLHCQQDADFLFAMIVMLKNTNNGYWQKCLIVDSKRVHKMDPSLVPVKLYIILQ